MKKILPRNVTSYDLLKTFAVVTMIIDHVGYYFFPDDMWWRAVGRLSFPIWFFLAGYANTRDVPSKFWVGGMFLLIMNWVTGLGFLPLNILFSIIVVRLSLDRIMQGARSGETTLWVVIFLCVLLLIPTGNLFEYGTIAILFGMFGFSVRRMGEGVFDKQYAIKIMLAVTLIYILSQHLTFGFSTPLFAIMGVGVILVCLMLFAFKPREYPNLSPVRGLLQLCGRHSLEIYVVHLTLFKFAALYLGDDRFEWFRWKLFIW